MRQEVPAAPVVTSGYWEIVNLGDANSVRDGRCALAVWPSCSPSPLRYLL